MVCLKKCVIIFLNCFCWSVYCVIGLILFNDQSSLSSSSFFFKLHTSATISSLRSYASKFMVRFIGEIETFRFGSQSYPQSTIDHSLPNHCYCATLICLSTSQCLLTVTNHQSFDSCEDRFSIHRDLTCFNAPPSPCLKALVDLKSMKFFYFFVAVGNAFCCIALNFGFLDLFVLVLL